MSALRILAGAAARARIAQSGLRPQDLCAIAAAAGGPKGLVLAGLDRFLMGDWLGDRDGPPLHLVGASIGALRLACAAQDDAGAALERFVRLYVDEEYEPPAGERQSQANLGRHYRDLLHEVLGPNSASALSHPRWRLHIVADRGRGWLRRERPIVTRAAFAALAALNLIDRRCLGWMLERTVFSDPRAPLPLVLDDLPTRHAPLTTANLSPVVLASGSIPLLFPAIEAIPGAPPGSYWDGGITDYHPCWPWAAWREPPGGRLVLFPHYESRLVPGWLDKALRWRHARGAMLGPVVLLAPTPQWVRSLPGGKIPDRGDYARWARSPGERRRVWNEVVRRSDELAREFALWLEQGCPVGRVEPL